MFFIGNFNRNRLKSCSFVKEFVMSKEEVKHRKEDKKKPALSPKERKAKKQEKKASKAS